MVINEMDGWIEEDSEQCVWGGCELTNSEQCEERGNQHSCPDVQETEYTTRNERALNNIHKLPVPSVPACLYSDPPGRRVRVHDTRERSRHPRGRRMIAYIRAHIPLLPRRRLRRRLRSLRRRSCWRRRRSQHNRRHLPRRLRLGRPRPRLCRGLDPRAPPRPHSHPRCGRLRVRAAPRRRRRRAPPRRPLLLFAGRLVLVDIQRL